MGMRPFKWKPFTCDLDDGWLIKGHSRPLTVGEVHDMVEAKTDMARAEILDDATRDMALCGEGEKYDLLAADLTAEEMGRLIRRLTLPKG